jgi:hypothetical protein
MISTLSLSRLTAPLRCAPPRSPQSQHRHRLRLVHLRLEAALHPLLGASPARSHHLEGDPAGETRAEEPEADGECGCHWEGWRVARVSREWRVS